MMNKRNKRDGSSWKPTIPSVRKSVVLQRLVHLGIRCFKYFGSLAER